MELKSVLWLTMLSHQLLKGSLTQFQTLREVKSGSSQVLRITLWVKRPWTTLIASTKASVPMSNMWTILLLITASQQITQRSRRRINAVTLVHLISTIATMTELEKCSVTFYQIWKSIHWKRVPNIGNRMEHSLSSLKLNFLIQLMILLNQSWLIKVTFTFQKIAMEKTQRITAASTWLFMGAGKAKRVSVKHTSLKQAISTGPPQTISSRSSHR